MNAPRAAGSGGPVVYILAPQFPWPPIEPLVDAILTTLIRGLRAT